MKQNNFLYLSMTAFTLSVTSCIDDFLNLEPQDSETEAVFFQTPEQFQEAANNLHTYTYDWGGSGNTSANNTYAIRFDYGTDLVITGNDAVSGTNAPGTTDPYYEQAYSWLRGCNQLIEKGLEYPNPDEIAGPVGQAYFFRAWQHFFLLQRF